MLTLVATPIGNLSDISARAVEAIAAADAVYCEDTRRALQLMNHLGLKKTLVSCHGHNERSRAAEVTDRVRNGEEIVYISDAGMPGISDPGAALTEACVRESLPFTVVPGASAVLTAAVLSGLPCGTFSFFGFLPRENRERKRTLERIAGCGHLAILYESPHRVADTLRELLGLLGDRPAALLRELTKKFETADRGTLSSLAERYGREEPRGECVIAVLCPERREAEESGEADAVIRAALEAGLSARDAASVAAALPGVSRKDAYARSLEIREQL